MFHSPKHIKAGLSVMPLESTSEFLIIKPADHVKTKGIYSCTNCGNSRQYDIDQNIECCEMCNCESWVLFELAEFKDKS
jgi:hypothetical protein